MDDFNGFKCVCGEMVVVMHAECKALLTPEQLAYFNETGRV